MKAVWVEYRRRKGDRDYAGHAKNLSEQHRIRLEDLMVEYGLDLHKAESWQHLAVLLAEQLGLTDQQWNDTKLRWVKSNKSSGRMVSWDEVKQSRLVSAIDKIIHERNCKRVEAVRILRKSPEWASHSEGSLASRYSQFAPAKKNKTGPRKPTKKLAAELIRRRNKRS